MPRKNSIKKAHLKEKFPVFFKFIKTSISILYQNPIAGKIFIFLEAQTFPHCSNIFLTILFVPPPLHTRKLFHPYNRAKMFPKNFAFSFWSPPRWSLTTPSLPPSLLRASSSTDKIGPRQRPRRAAKLRVGKDKGVGRVNSSPKAWPSLQICVARSVSWRFPGSSCKLRYSLCNPPFQPSSVSLGANPLRNYGGASASQQAMMLGGRCFSFANEEMAKSGSCQRTRRDAKGLDWVCLTMI